MEVVPETPDSWLRHLFERYFHQDAFLDDPDWEAIVQRFQREVPGRGLAAVREALDALLSGGSSEDELADLLDDANCMYDPSADGLTVEAWLRAVRAQLG